MAMTLTLLRAALLAAMLGVLLPQSAAARDDVPDDIAALENPAGELSARDVRYFQKQFKAQCARCHGIDGSGGGEEAAAQAVPPASFSDAAFMASRSDGQLYYQILMGGGDRCAMPAFGPESAHGWNDDKIWRMVTFVRRFSQPPAD
jgi:mono/diheme cytochrome c family protein